MSKPDRTAHWGTCENNACQASMVIYPHPGASQDLPDEEQWKDPTRCIDCPVCGEWMDWGGTDPAHEIIKNY